MRWLVVFALMAIGCVASVPLDDAGITADLATQTAYELGKIKPESPASDICQNCNGTGKIGDGRIEHLCPECRGTGKK